MCVFTKVIAEFELREGLLRRDIPQGRAGQSAPSKKGKCLRDRLAGLLRCREVLTKRARSARKALSRYPLRSQATARR
jgi:hypothetical protein